MSSSLRNAESPRKPFFFNVPNVRQSSNFLRPPAGTARAALSDRVCLLLSGVSPVVGWPPGNNKSTRYAAFSADQHQFLVLFVKALGEVSLNPPNSYSGNTVGSKDEWTTRIFRGGCRWPCYHPWFTANFAVDGKSSACCADMTMSLDISEIRKQSIKSSGNRNSSISIEKPHRKPIQEPSSMREMRFFGILPKCFL